jgi:putative endonuclease
VSAGPWWLYVLRTGQDKLYTGIALDVSRRIEQHRDGTGAKALRGKGPLKLVYRRRVGEHGLALRLEKRLKQCSREVKEALIRRNPRLATLRRLLGLE